MKFSLLIGTLLIAAIMTPATTAQSSQPSCTSPVEYTNGECLPADAQRQHLLEGQVPGATRLASSAIEAAADASTESPSVANTAANEVGSAAIDIASDIERQRLGDVGGAVDVAEDSALRTYSTAARLYETAIADVSNSYDNVWTVIGVAAAVAAGQYDALDDLDLPPAPTDEIVDLYDATWSDVGAVAYAADSIHETLVATAAGAYGHAAGAIVATYDDSWSSFGGVARVGADAWDGVPRASPVDTYDDAWSAIGYGAGAGANGWRLVEPDGDENELGDYWESLVCTAHVGSADCDPFTDLAPYALSCAVATDFDCDGLGLVDEFCWGTDPLDPDSDDDRWQDGSEADYWKAPGDECTAQGLLVFRYQAALRDDDQDGVPNILDRDSDDDHLQDGDEVQGRFGRATKPELRDTDGDSLSDYEELCDRQDRFANYGCDLNGWGSYPDDSDSDNDGASDGVEADRWGEAQFRTNFDRDGITNNLLDADSDGDSMPGTANALDGAEWSRTPSLDAGNWDSDHDGLPDGYEIAKGFDPASADSLLDADADGLTNLFEYEWGRLESWDEARDGAWTQGLDPHNPDMDGDLLLDGQEYYGSLNPYARAYYDGNRGSTNLLEADTDGDRLSDGDEVLMHGTDPNDAMGDKDGDGVYDTREMSGWYVWVNGDEVRVYSDFENRHSDLDAWDDYEEFMRGTNPQDEDSDGDGIWDGMEPIEGCNPVEQDSDKDGIADGTEHSSVPRTRCDRADTDADGLSDPEELQGWTIYVDGQRVDVTSDPSDFDTDKDGLNDGQEWSYRTHPRNPDTDGDGIPDATEAVTGDPTASDRDGDGLSDGEEERLGTNPDKRDTDGDLLDDYAEARVYRTNPLREDTDRDGFLDIEDARPFIEDMPPAIIRIHSKNYAEAVSLEIAESSHWFIDEESFLFEAASGYSYDCSANWGGGQGTVGGTDWIPSEYVARTWNDGAVGKAEITFDPPLRYCGAYEFDIEDEHGNGVRVRLELTGDMTCLQQSSFDLWLGSLAIPYVGSTAASGISGNPGAGAGFAFGYDVGVRVAQGAGAREIVGAWPITLFNTITGALPFLASTVVFGVQSAVVLGSADLILCDDQRSLAPTEPRDDEQSTYLFDRAGARLVLSDPGFEDHRADPLLGSTRTFARGTGWERIHADAPDLSREGLRTLLGNNYPEATGRLSQYCGWAHADQAYFEVDVLNGSILSARHVQRC